MIMGKHLTIDEYNLPESIEDIEWKDLIHIHRREFGWTYGFIGREEIRDNIMMRITSRGRTVQQFLYQNYWHRWT